MDFGLAKLISRGRDGSEVSRASVEESASVVGIISGTPSYMSPEQIRGQAYLALRQGNNATAEFQKIIDHRGIVLNSPIAVLARLGLGRTYALSGDSVKAGKRIGSSSIYGKMPTRTSQSSNKPSQNTPSFSSEWRDSRQASDIARGSFLCSTSSKF
jgi:serine/threonine protein kinase